MKKRCPVSHLQSSLNYEFRHIIFLEEALTHSSSSTKGLYPGSCLRFQKRENAELKVLGECVLKMVTLEWASNTIPEPGTGNNELSLIQAHEKLTASNILEMIGDDLGLEDFIQVKEDEEKSADYDEESLFPGIIKAIFGAVYMDSQLGSSLAGLRKCFCLFLWLWRNYIGGDTKDNLDKKDYQNIDFQPSYMNFFQPPSPNVDVITVLKRKLDPEKFNPFGLEYLQTSVLDYQFKHKRLLHEALTHESILENFKELANIRDLKCLQVVGRAVFELSIAEYLYWCSVGGKLSSESVKNGLVPRLCPEMLSKFTCDKFKSLIALGLGLSGNILRDPPSMEVRNVHEFLDSLVGALYVDSKEEHGYAYVNLAVVAFVDNMKIFAKPTLGYYLPPGVKRKCRAYDPMFISTNDEAPLPLVGCHHNASLDLDRFLHHWEEYAISVKEHFRQFQRALDREWNYNNRAQQDYLSKSWFNAIHRELPEATCNKLEFERFSVYNIAARMYIEMGRGNKLKTYSVNIEDVLKEPKKRKGKKINREWLHWKSTGGDAKCEEEDEAIETERENTLPEAEAFSFSAVSNYLHPILWIHYFKYLLFKKPVVEWIVVGLLAVFIFSLLVWIKPPIKHDS